MKASATCCAPQADLYNWTQISGDDLETEFQFKDESWNEIKHIYARGWLDWLGLPGLPTLENNCPNTRVVFNGNSIKVRSSEHLPLRWVFIKYHIPIGKVYAIEYDVTIGSEFAELQFAFNYRSIMNRVRFMIVDNKKLILQTVEKGSFISPICTKPLTLKIGTKYRTRIEIVDDSFYYYLDGSLKMAASLPGHGAREDDGFALILFATEPQCRIVADLDQVRIFRGAHKTSTRA